MKPGRIVVVVPDLFFATRIATAAKHARVEVVQAALHAAPDVCRAQPPDLVIVDLDAAGDPIGLVGALKRNPAAPTIVGFCRHTATATIQAARAAGVDQVLPRSAFFPRLDEILGRGAIQKPTEAP